MYVDLAIQITLRSETDANTSQTYPLDTRKTRAQSVLLGKTKEIGEASMAVAKSSMYKGLSIILIRTGVNNMILLSMFEYIKARIDQLPD